MALSGNDDLGYPSDKPCVVCKEVNENQVEPRYFYVVCLTHRWLTPVEVAEAARRYAEKNL